MGKYAHLPLVQVKAWTDLAEALNLPSLPFHAVGRWAEDGWHGAAFWGSQAWERADVYAWLMNEQLEKEEH